MESRQHQVLGPREEQAVTRKKGRALTHDVETLSMAAARSESRGSGKSWRDAWGHQEPQKTDQRHGPVKFML